MKTWIGIDTGGTFTDFVALYEDGTCVTKKILSTPDDPSRAVLEGIAALVARLPRKGSDDAGEAALDITYGSTVATNALLERRGARTAFITNRGFEDLLLLARQARSHLYQLRVVNPEPLVAKEHTFGVSGRLTAQGGEQAPINEEELSSLALSLQRASIESVSICLLHSYANPAHEQQIIKALSSLSIPISASHEIIPEYREYERAATTTVNAYVAPKMKTHVERLAAGVSQYQSSLRVMQSNGGAIRASLAAREPVRTVLSGPAGGVVGAFSCAKQAGFSHVLTFDMGGTSTDVALCDDQIRATSEGQVAGLPVRVPLVDVHTVGAGGGSVARLDPGGALKVGPESASAVPGPACYGKGGPITVTDANVVLGRIDTNNPLGGTLQIDAAASFSAMEKLASQMNKDVHQTAEGVIRVANAAMEKALRVVSVERGLDPRQFALLSFGGAGGLHACALAESLRMSTVIIPFYAGVLSAFGMLEADVSRDTSKTWLSPLDAAVGLEEQFTSLEGQAVDELLQEGFTREQISVVKKVDARYQGQSFEISLPVTTKEELASSFAEQYQQRYGYTLSNKIIELVTLRVRATGRHQQPTQLLHLPAVAAIQPIKKQRAFIAGELRQVPVYERSMLYEGCLVEGPALIIETIATTWLAEGWSATVHASGALLLRVI
jgi:N-methylhydantoinase A